MQTISAIKNRIIYMFETDDLLGESTKIGLPSIGVVYNSLRGQTDSAKTGLAAICTIDIYIIGGQQCVEKISAATGIKMTTTQFLDDIRNAIKLTIPQVGSGSSQVPRPQAQRKWTFVLEQPTPIADGVIAYVQRWQTTILLT